jgi:hypothetical protein
MAEVSFHLFARTAFNVIPEVLRGYSGKYSKHTFMQQ